MNQPEQISIPRKLKRLMKYLNTLEPFSILTLAEYLDNYNHQLAVERLLELIIQASLDVTRSLLKQQHQVNPTTNADVFLAAAEYGLINPDLSESLAEFGKFRNVLAHMYEEIDPEIVFLTIQEALTLFPQYVRQITSYLDSVNSRS